MQPTMFHEPILSDDSDDDDEGVSSREQKSKGIKEEEEQVRGEEHSSSDDKEEGELGSDDNRKEASSSSRHKSKKKHKHSSRHSKHSKRKRKHSSNDDDESRRKRHKKDRKHRSKRRGEPGEGMPAMNEMANLGVDPNTPVNPVMGALMMQMFSRMMTSMMQHRNPMNAAAERPHPQFHNRGMSQAAMIAAASNMASQQPGGGPLNNTQGTQQAVLMNQFAGMLRNMTPQAFNDVANNFGGNAVPTSVVDTSKYGLPPISPHYSAPRAPYTPPVPTNPIGAPRISALTASGGRTHAIHAIDFSRPPPPIPGILGGGSTAASPAQPIPGSVPRSDQYGGGHEHPSRHRNSRWGAPVSSRQSATPGQRQHHHAVSRGSAGFGSSMSPPRSSVSTGPTPLFPEIQRPTASVPHQPPATAVVSVSSDGTSIESKPVRYGHARPPHHDYGGGGGSALLYESGGAQPPSDPEAAATYWKGYREAQSWAHQNQYGDQQPRRMAAGGGRSDSPSSKPGPSRGGTRYFNQSSNGDGGVGGSDNTSTVVIKPAFKHEWVEVTEEEKQAAAATAPSMSQLNSGSNSPTTSEDDDDDSGRESESDEQPEFPPMKPEKEYANFSEADLDTSNSNEETYQEANAEPTAPGDDEEGMAPVDEEMVKGEEEAPVAVEMTKNQLRRQRRKRAIHKYEVMKGADFFEIQQMNEMQEEEKMKRAKERVDKL